MSESLFVVEKTRAVVAAMNLDHSMTKSGITISIGLTEYKSDKTMLEAFDAADNALYPAKTAARIVSGHQTMLIRKRARPVYS